tara:strand:+ start:946 stop:1515 length:570 start_codon:yes stop_codon:yes gene_type:complete
MYFILIFISSFLFAEYEKLPQSFLKDLDNKKRDINEFFDNGPAVINFWFLACEPCKKEMVYLDQFNDRYSKYGFKVVSVNIDNSRTFNRVKPYVNSKNYSFEVLSDPKSLFFRKVGAKICPYLLVVNEKGEIVNRHSGYNPGDEIKLEKEIVNLILPQIQSDTTLVDTSIIKLLEEISLKTNIIEEQSE